MKELFKVIYDTNNNKLVSREPEYKPDRLAERLLGKVFNYGPKLGKTNLLVMYAATISDVPTCIEQLKYFLTTSDKVYTHYEYSTSLADITVNAYPIIVESISNGIATLNLLESTETELEVNQIETVIPDKNGRYAYYYTQETDINAITELMKNVLISQKYKCIDIHNEELNILKNRK